MNLLRIANWNVERPAFTSPKNENRIQLLRDLNADIITLTETSVAVDLTPEYHGRLTESSQRKPRKGEAVAGIWWRNDRFRLLEQIKTADPTEAVCVILESEFGSLIVYSSIIPYHGYTGPDRKSGRWEEHSKAIVWHGTDWKELRNKYASHCFIAAGDYNQHRDGVGRYGNREIRNQLSQALSEAKLTCVTEMDFVATGICSRRNVDHVCLCENLSQSLVDVDAWEGTIDGLRLSDHNGVIVDIDLSTVPS